jgi:hypothetical protein
MATGKDPRGEVNDFLGEHDVALAVVCVALVVVFMIVGFWH